MGIAGPPPPGSAVPPPIARLAGGSAVAVWRNELGGTTFLLPGARYAKWAPAGSGLDLAAEGERLAWAAGLGARVPRVLDAGEDDSGSWLVTAALRGRSAADQHWLSRPDRAVHAIGRGLRALHDALPVGDCPFDWSVPERLARARARGLAPEPALENAPPVDRLVVCHGDACAPNTLLTDDGAWSGHVDLSTLGVADRWADLAAAAWSAELNYGRDLTGQLLAAYGVRPDEERLDYYRRLWHAT
ncbi:MAG: aminoglycoside phosphotransferase [Naasia sp.]|nr:aminoglycoside phosphotransferase [Naasia sp.]